MLEEVESESSDDSSIDPDYSYEDVIAFRASALKNGQGTTKLFTRNEQGMHICNTVTVWWFYCETISYHMLSVSDINITSLVQWNQIDYNVGNFFDGTFFTAPECGLYSFYASVEQSMTLNTGTAMIYIFVDGIEKVLTRRKYDNYGSITIQSTLKLAEDAKVEIRFSGQLDFSNDARTTYFEGKFISSMDDSSDEDEI